MLWKLRLRRHFYRSDVDRTMEPYCVYRPKGRRGRKGLPLVILLHGYGGDERSMIQEDVAALADRYGMLLLAVRGRGNSFYDRQAEEDFFRAFEATCARYHIDRDRVYLVGTSMGSTGVWRMVTRFPHLFAAVAPVCGWTQPRLWYRKWYGPADNPGEVDACMRPLLDDLNSLDAAENMIHVPAFVLHGARDETVSVEHSRRMVARLRALGAAVVYREYARSGHKGFRTRWDSVFRWFCGGDAIGWEGGRRRRLRGTGAPLRRVVAPECVSYVTRTLRHRRAYWVVLDALERTFSPARIQVEWRPDGEVRVRTANIRAFTLHLPPALAARPAVICVRIGREMICECPRQPRMSFIREGGDWRAVAFSLSPSGLRKRPGLEGPVADAFTSSFMIVVGEAPEDRREAERFSNFWRRWMLPRDSKGRPRGRVRILSPAQARREKAANLVLFGCVESNAIVREAASRLPIVPHRSGVRFGGEMLAGTGLLMIYPDPRTSDRYLVLAHGHFPWRMKDLESLPCLLPDYVVFDPRITPRRSAHKAWDVLAVRPGEDDIPEDEKPLRYLPDCYLRAGFFDETWRLSPR